MRFFKDSKIKVRLNIVLSSVMAILFSALGFYLLRMQNENSENQTDQRMYEQVNDLATLVEQQLKENQEKVNIGINYAELYFSGLGEIEVNDNYKVEFNAMNQISKESHTEYLSGWSLNKQIIQESFDVVDHIQSEIGGTATIFQRIDKGFLRISTNVMKLDGSRAIGTYIPNDSPVIKAILQGTPFYGRAFVVNDWYLTAYHPIFINGRVEGILYVGMKEKDMTSLKAVFAEKKNTYYENGYPFLVDDKGNFIIHPTEEGNNFYDAEFFQQLINSGREEGKTQYMWQGKSKYQYFRYIPEVASYVCASIYEEDIKNIFRRFLTALIIALIIGIVTFMLINSLISNDISKKLGRAVKLAIYISKGGLDDTLEIEQKDEIGELAVALNEMTERLRSIAINITQGANQISAASEQMSGTSQQLSQGANEQASSVEEISSTMEEIASNIQQNTENAQQTKGISANAEKGIEIVAQRAQESFGATKEISEKIQIINDIAFQTNILALNAAVEAARAGEHGKGFAVVAAEVRKLAERSKVAADEIVELAGRSLNLAEDAGKKLDEMLPEVRKTTQLVQEIAAASMEQNNGAGQVNNAIQQLNNVTQQNASASEEMASSAEELASHAESLKNMMSIFKISSYQSPVRGAERKIENMQLPLVDKSIKKGVNPEKGFDLKIEDKDDQNFESF